MTDDREVGWQAWTTDPEMHSGDACFTGTRAPVATLVEILRDGRTLEEFLEGYPTVERWQADAVRELVVKAP